MEMQLKLTTFLAVADGEKTVSSPQKNIKHWGGGVEQEATVFTGNVVSM